MSKIDEIEKRINAGDNITIEPDGTVRDMTEAEIAARDEDERRAKEKAEARSRKPILCLDFDGVIHSYSSGWKGADVIPDPPVAGALQFIAEALNHFRVAVFSSRSHQPGGQTAMREWLGRWSVDPNFGMPCDFDHGTWGAIEWPLEKPAAFVTIDDRAITFDGTWPAIDALQAFKPWNKR
jgi:hypothetical protein